jgi:hypothetical protein
VGSLRGWERKIIIKERDNFVMCVGRARGKACRWFPWSVVSCVG